MKKSFLLSMLLLGLSVSLYATTNNGSNGSADRHADNLAEFMNHRRTFINQPINEVLQNPKMMHSNYMKARTSLSRLLQKYRCKTYEEYLAELDDTYEELKKSIAKKEKEENEARINRLKDETYMKIKIQEAYIEMLRMHYLQQQRAATTSN